MHRLSLTLKTITPLFLGGSDPRGSPELRLPALRGALRYWLRAALGGVIGDNDRNALAEVEGRVFGATDEKIGASAITLRFHNPEIKSYSFSEFIGADKSTNRYPGIAYLWFSARGTNSGKERCGLMGTFDLEMQTRFGVQQAEQRFQEAYVALWLWANFGGLGSRARRAAGNLQVVKVAENHPLSQTLPLEVHAKTPLELARQLSSGIRRCHRLLAANHPKGMVSQPSAFDVLAANVCKIWVHNQTYQSWKEAVNEFGEIYQRFRSKRKPDYETVKKAIKNREPLSGPVERAAFGLPIQFYYRSLGGKSAGLQSEHYNRRSSPLAVRVTRLADGNYVLLVIWFRSTFLPKGEKLKLANNKLSGSPNLPDDRLIQVFLTGFSQGDASSNRGSLTDESLKIIEVKYE